MIVVSRWETKALQSVRQFRVQTYRDSRRDQNFVEAWQGDKYDADATHIMTTNQDCRILAAVRVSEQGRWPLEDKVEFCGDKMAGIELGRLCVAQRIIDGRRTLFDLVAFTCQLYLGQNRPNL